MWSWGCAEQGQLGRVAKFMCVRGGRRGLNTILTPQVGRTVFPVFLFETNCLLLDFKTRVLVLWGWAHPESFA